MIRESFASYLNCLDLDLVRDILLKLEPLPAHFDNPIPLTVGEEPLVFKGRSTDEIAYQIRIMSQGELIAMGGIDANGHITRYYGFRWLGHEFLDDVRNPKPGVKPRSWSKG